MGDVSKIGKVLKKTFETVSYSLSQSKIGKWFTTMFLISVFQEAGK